VGRFWRFCFRTPDLLYANTRPFFFNKFIFKKQTVNKPGGIANAIQSVKVLVEWFTK
jgi:hypothetical protein